MNGMINDENATVLRGLVWMASLLDGKEVARPTGELAITCYRKVRGVGPRAPKVGNACVWALGAMPGMGGVGQLALLKVRVKYRPAQQTIEKALADAIAELLASPAKRREMGKRGMLKASKQRSWKEACGQFRQCLLRIWGQLL